ncbi:helix-turn-helix domain-containing protein [Candidatus Pacearchaeota archaeon]|nr:helix-turn-helix domain-containing protein [Candidatus Pacearchaeota archaeon]
MDEEIQKQLQEFGLSNTEAKVYLALLGLGKSQAGTVTKKSNVNRTNVYDALERLIEKGLVSYVTENNIKFFEAVNPERLREMLGERQKKLDKTIEELRLRYNKSKKEEDAFIFRGKKGIKSIFENILSEKKDLFVYGAESRFKEMFPFYQKHWNEERAKLKINVKMIYSEKVREIKRKEHLKLLEMKFLPEIYDFPSTIMIYSDKVITIIWLEEPFGFMIKSKEAVTSNMNFFELLWKISKK